MSALLRALRGRLPPTHFLSAMQAASLSQPGLWSSASPSCGTAFTQPSTRGLAVSVSPPVRAMDDITAEPTLQRYLKLAHSHTRRPNKSEPVAQGVEFVMTQGQISRQHLTEDMSRLTDCFLDNSHLYSLEELCAWCDICRRLDYTGTQRNQRDMAEAVRGAVEGRVQELEPYQLASVAWLLASTHTQLPRTMEEEVVRVLMRQSRDASPEDLASLIDAATWFVLGPHKALVTRVCVAAVGCLKWCRPALAVRLVGAGLFTSLPTQASERAMLAKGLSQHMLGREGEYKRDKQSLQRALHVLTELTEGDPASQEFLASVQHMSSVLSSHTQDGGQVHSSSTVSSSTPAVSAHTLAAA